MITVIKTWGREDIFENNKLYCGKLMTCELGKWSSKGKYHFHKKKDETFFITRGQLLLDLKNKSMILNPGDKFRIKPGQVHRFISLTPLCRFIEVSTQHKNKDSYYE